jgi:hypothetical protein
MKRKENVELDKLIKKKKKWWICDFPIKNNNRCSAYPIKLKKRNHLDITIDHERRDWPRKTHVRALVCGHVNGVVTRKKVGIASKFYKFCYRLLCSLLVLKFFLKKKSSEMFLKCGSGCRRDFGIECWIQE